MIARVLLIPFGSVWKVRALCAHHNPFVRKAARFLYNLYQYENSSSLAWNATFAGEPTFPHGMKSIFISGDARVGKNCIIFQQVTIGSVMLPDARKKGAPSIGDNVYIGAGAKIVGAVHVGDNVRIGANAVVHSDVPDNCIVVSGEQRIIPRDFQLDNRFYTWNDGWGYLEGSRWVRVTDPEVLSALTR